MILIFSDKNDYSTDRVMEYLFHMKADVIRINREDTIQVGFCIHLSDNSEIDMYFSVGQLKVSLSKVKSIWFRRGGLYFSEIQSGSIRKNKRKIARQVNDYLSAEQVTLNEFVYEHILNNPNLKVLGNPFKMNTRKLTVLNKAIKYGIKVPQTLITTKKSDVIDFLNMHESIITKGIQDNFTPYTGDEAYTCWTEVINKENLQLLPYEFFPSLFQERVEKLFDVRTFYLDGDFFTIAIFSQETALTEVDFRNYNLAIPNRKSSLKLPNQVEMQLKELLDDLKLNTASIDLIYTKNNEFVFLEINPVGQYDMVGKHMNFQLDKKIASWLAHKKN